MFALSPEEPSGRSQVLRVCLALSLTLTEQGRVTTGFERSRLLILCRLPTTCVHVKSVFSIH